LVGDLKSAGEAATAEGGEVLVGGGSLGDLGGCVAGEGLGEVEGGERVVPGLGVEEGAA
jgi:hypothetical protein